MPDPIFAQPMLASIHDAFDGERDDLTLYMDLIRELRARPVLDIGCGTGSLPILLARCGVEVTGLDPAAASLAVARRKAGAGEVTWIQGDVTTLPPVGSDLAVMTGNVAQVFPTDEEWIATLRGIRRALSAYGHLAFETRRPQRRASEDWAVDTGPVARHLPGVGEIEGSLADTGFTVWAVRDAPDRPGREHAFVARRCGEP